MDTKLAFKAALLSEFLILTHLFSAKVTCQSWDGIVVTLADYQSLSALKHELVDPNGALSSWNDTGLGACSGAWIGIKCAKGQVIVIHLPWKNLSGRLTEKIEQLQSLRKISFHDNSITGPIPTSLGFLPELRGIQLYNNRFSGSIPGSLGSCPVLQAIELGNNFLTGIVPDGLVNCSKLIRLGLGNNSLTGPIPVGFSRFRHLLFLSLESNHLSGSIPGSIGSLLSLRELDLSGNLLEGILPESLFSLKNLSVLNVSNNHFHCSILGRIGEMSSLRAIDFSKNGFEGEIPGRIGDLPNLKSFNISFNNMSGNVPPSLHKKFDVNSFMGNANLCGYTGSTPCASPPPVTPSPSPVTTLSRPHSKLATKDVVLILFGILVIVLATACCILLYCLLKKATYVARDPEKGRGKRVVTTPPEEEASGGMLVHFDEDMGFSADDLLCATAEVLGKSTYGTVYKATMQNGDRLAVKRLREKVTKGQREFEAHVKGLGELRHPNVVAIRAFYCGPKGEKLLVFDYMRNGSLANFLHGGVPVNWAKRIKIIKDVAKGLHYLHNDANIVHGNLTSNNVLIDKDENARIGDFGLSQVMVSIANANVVASAKALGYRAPELYKLKKATVKCDVYSFGVIVLEILTGKSPGEAIDGQDLPLWVASVVKQEWTNEVFDVELIKDASAIGDELLIALRLALHCVDPMPISRPGAEEILSQLAEIRVMGGVEEELESPPRLKGQ